MAYAYRGLFIDRSTYISCGVKSGCKGGLNEDYLPPVKNNNTASAVLFHF